MKKIFLFLFILCFLSQNVHADICTGLQGWWRFDEGSGTTTADSSTNGYTGTLNIVSAFPAWETGKIGPYALSFGGKASSYVLNKTSAIVGGGSAWTVSAWIRPSVNTTVDGIATYCERASSGNDILKIDGFDEGAGNVSNKAFFITYRNDAGTLLQCRGNHTDIYTDGQWHHVAGVFNGSTIQLYVDGVANGSACSWSGSNNNFTNAGIQSWTGNDIADATNAAFNGGVDEVRIYNRALSSSDITQLYNYTSGTCGAVLPDIINPGKVIIKGGNVVIN